MATFEINKVCIDWRDPFLALFRDQPQCKNMVPRGFFFPKPWLFFANKWVNVCRNYVKNTPTDTFANDTFQIDHSPVVAHTKVFFLR